MDISPYCSPEQRTALEGKGSQRAALPAGSAGAKSQLHSSLLSRLNGGR